MSRIASVFATGRKVFIPFIMAGDPNRALSQEFLNALPKAGADIIEIGVPFSDPAADGPVIEAAGNRALAQEINLTQVLQMVQEFRQKNIHTPIILMGYYNPIYRYGVERFAQDAAAAGVDGLIIVDLPPEEEAEVTQYLSLKNSRHSGNDRIRSFAAANEVSYPESRSGSQIAQLSNDSLHSSGKLASGMTECSVANIDLIRLIAPTTPTQRQQYIAQHASGFIYYVTVKGVTGGQTAIQNDLRAAINNLKAHTPLPVAAGFGIKTPEQAAQAAQVADAVVIGSALVQQLYEEGLEAALNLATKLAEAVHQNASG